MPTVFISYSSAQQHLAQELEAKLIAKGVKVWRDKTNLRVGERWPKKLGDAIAEANTVVLLWSAEASQSDFVELEWNIAVAMNKPVLPCPLDATSLPPTLKPSHRILGNDTAAAADQILTALQGQAPASPTAQQSTLLNALTTVNAAEPQQVLQQIKTIVNQPNWSVGGNVYHAQGDIHIIGETVKAKPTESTKLDRWIKWVGLGVATLTFLGLLLDLPTKIMNMVEKKDLPATSRDKKTEPVFFQSGNQPSQPSSPPKSSLPEEIKPDEGQPERKSKSKNITREQPFPSPQTLSGIVTDQVTGDPVTGATVSIPALNKQVTTNPQGFFTLDVIQKNNEKVFITVQKDRYETYRTKATPGNANLGFVLRRKS
ncbi:MAG: TIR domain-containing protein [Nitrospira sp.]|nr:TIR domain-containing protein [Nitrospira sp.]